MSDPKSRTKRTAEGEQSNRPHKKDSSAGSSFDQGRAKHGHGRGQSSQSRSSRDDWRQQKDASTHPQSIWNFEQGQEGIAVVEGPGQVDLAVDAPTPLVEYVRWKEVEGMRTHYDNLCQEHLMTKAPAESFNRWLFQQLSEPSEKRKGDDPLLTNSSVASEGDVLRRELLADLPRSTYLSWAIRSDLSKTVAVFKSYLIDVIGLVDETLSKEKEHDSTETPESAKKEGNTNVALVKSAHEIKNFLIDEKAWAEQDHKPIKTLASDVANRLKAVALKCKPFLREYYSAPINKVIAGVVEYSQTISQKLATVDLSDSHTVKIDVTDEKAKITFKDDVHEISNRHYNKLRTLYSINSKAIDPSKEKFEERLYVLLRRYTTFFGPGEREGASFHAAAPASVFEVLLKEFGVCQESFASPLNCYFKRFGSAFPDIDKFFGSVGSFFDYTPQEGSFETGPPYTEEVMDRMAVRLDQLLSASTKPLSFIVFVPDWNDPPADYLKIMGASPFNRGDFVVSGKRHSYVLGKQHLVSENEERFFLLPFATHVYILQNQAGAEKWPTTPENIGKIKRALENWH